MQGLYVVLVAVLVGAVSASPLEPRASLDDQIKAALENIKKNMGKPQMGFPALDPFVYSHLDLNIDQAIAKIKGSIDNFTMKKLSTLEIQKVKLSILTLSLSFNVSLAELDLSGNYDIDGTLGGDLLPVYGKGPFSVKAGNIWVAGTIQLGSNNTFLYIKKFDLDYYLGYTDIKLDGILGGGELSDVVNAMLSDMVPKLAASHKKEIAAKISDMVVTMANKMLDGKTLNDILGLISGKSTAAPKAVTAASV